MSMTNASSTYFERVAGEWDDLRSGYFGEELRQAAIRKAYLRQEQVAADVGTGTGFIAAGVAPLVSQVYVLDGSPAMLDQARKNLTDFDNIIFQQADGQSLPLPSGSVDVAFANMYLHHCPDPQAAIAEMVRILKPGGRLVITDMNAHEQAWMKREMADEWLGFTSEDLRIWLRDANLVNILIDSAELSCCASSQDCVQEKVKIGVFVATGTRRIAVRAEVQQQYGRQAASNSTRQADSGCDCSPESGKAPEKASQSAQPQPSSSCCGSPTDASAQQGCCGNSAKTASEAAEKATNSCCSSDNIVPNEEQRLIEMGYTLQDLAAVPQEAAQFSLSCGNPLAAQKILPGDVVLDIGSGAGMDSFLAAKATGPTGKVIGVDMTPAMLKRARATAERVGALNVEFRQGWAEALPVEDGTVDVILSNCVINLTEDKGQVFTEAYRVLKPGGRLEVSDVVTSTALPLDTRYDENGWCGCVGGALPEQEYRDLVAQAGFTSIQTVRSMPGGEMNGVEVYSVILSATKPGES
jgi:arsenite methyltransferase